MFFFSQFQSELQSLIQTLDLPLKKSASQETLLRLSSKSSSLEFLIFSPSAKIYLIFPFSSVLRSAASNKSL